MAVRFRPQTAPSDEELEYLNAHNAPLRFERSLDGDLIVTPPTGGATGLQNAELVGQLRDWNRQWGHGKVLESSTGVSIGLNGAPDAGWISGPRYHAIPKAERSKFLKIAPELVFELMSPSEAAAATARRASEWVRAGVRLAVVLDPERRSAIPHDRNGAGAPVSPILRVDKAILPGADAALELDLAAIFDAAD
ncbi:MAG: Uma2 family endonuclease [Candidatus Baltobacteraceae bacterium]